MRRRVRLLNVDVDDITMDELVENFREGVMLTLHVDSIMKLQTDPTVLYGMFVKTGKFDLSLVHHGWVAARTDENGYNTYVIPALSPDRSQAGDKYTFHLRPLPGVVLPAVASLHGLPKITIRAKWVHLAG